MNNQSLEEIKYKKQIKKVRKAIFTEDVLYKIINFGIIRQDMNEYRNLEKKILKLYKLTEQLDYYIKNKDEKEVTLSNIRRAEKYLEDKYIYLLQYGKTNDNTTFIYSMNKKIDHLRDLIIGLTIDDYDINEYFMQDSTYYEIQDNIEYLDGNFEDIQSSCGLSGIDPRTLRVKLPHTTNLDTVIYNVKTIKNAIDFYEDNENKFTLEELERRGNEEVYLFLQQHEEDNLGIGNTKIRSLYMR